jgi:hypothetical protein
MKVIEVDCSVRAFLSITNLAIRMFKYQLSLLADTYNPRYSGNRDSKKQVKSSPDKMLVRPHFNQVVLNKH